MVSLYTLTIAGPVVELPAIDPRLMTHSAISGALNPEQEPAAPTDIVDDGIPTQGGGT